jgi:catechol 2,3-dioxygenase-like lactoylglutathione lyase family enzyme
MVRLDHLTLAVSHYARSRDWYVANLGLKVEFELRERRTVALQDDVDFTLFLVETSQTHANPTCTLTFRVDDVEAKYRELSERGLAFDKAPQKLNCATRTGICCISGTRSRCGRRAASKRGRRALFPRGKSTQLRTSSLGASSPRQAGSRPAGSP